MSTDTIFYSDGNDVMITNMSFVVGPKTFLLKIINSFYFQKDIAVRGCCSGGIVVVAGAGLTVFSILQPVNVPSFLLGCLVSVIGGFLLIDKKEYTRNPYFYSAIMLISAGIVIGVLGQITNSAFPLIILGLLVTLFGISMLIVSKQYVLVIRTQIENSEELEEYDVLYGSLSYIEEVATALQRAIEEQA